MNITRLRKSFSTGLAFFAMVFGSGNLVFPLLTGQKTLGSYPFGMLGMMITTVIISFIGYVGVVQCKCNVRKYFEELPDVMYWFIAIVIFFIIGPLYVIPRCALVAFGGVKELTPHLHPAYFSFFFCTTSFVLALQEEKVVNILGKYLTPFKLGSILFVIFGALYAAPYNILPSADISYSFWEGMKDGYQPMDMLGIIFFSGMFYKAVERDLKKEKNKDPKELYKRSVMVGAVGLSCIGIVYLLLIFLGAKYAMHTVGLNKELILPRITRIALGDMATVLIAVTLFFATLATSLTLMNVFTEFLTKELFKGRINRYLGLGFAAILSFAMSLIGFDAIIYFAGTYILSWLYPCLIVFTLFKLVKLKVFS